MPFFTGDESLVGNDTCTGTFRRSDSKEPGARPSEPPSVEVKKSLKCIYSEVSRPNINCFLRSLIDLWPYASLHPSFCKAAQPFQSNNPHTASLPQLARTNDRMPMPTGLLFGTQRTPTKQQWHCQRSNTAALNEDRIGMQSIATTSEAMLPSYSTVSSV